MKLYQYLGLYRESALGFSLRSGVPPATLHKYVHGAGANLRNAMKVHRASRGEVTFEDLLPYEIDPQEVVDFNANLRELQARESRRREAGDGDEA